MSVSGSIKGIVLYAKRVIRASTDKLRDMKGLSTGAAILSVTTLGSYIMGLVRDRIFAHTFGTGRELDIYNAAFIIPDLLLTIFVLSAISPAFIPLFTGLNAEGKKEEADRLASTVMVSAVGIIMILGCVVAVVLPYLAPYVVPGFNAEETATYVTLSRLLLISPVIMGISNTMGAMLVSYKRFWAYGLSPIFYNVGIIIGALLSPRFGMNALVAGTILGALVHLTPRLLDLRKTSYQPRRIALKDKNFLRVLRLMLPKMFGHPVEQIQFSSFSSIATLLTAGSVTALSFARNFQSVPVSLFGIAFSVSAFPLMSEAAARRDGTMFWKHFSQACKAILLTTIPSALFLFIFSDLPIRILLGGGKFGEASITRTAGILSAFALSICTESLIHLFARAFYSLKNTLIPVMLSIMGLVISVGFARLRFEELGLVAIPYGFFLGSFTEVCLMGLILWRFAPRKLTR